MYELADVFSLQERQALIRWHLMDHRQTENDVRGTEDVDGRGTVVARRGVEPLFQP